MNIEDYIEVNAHITYITRIGTQNTIYGKILAIQGHEVFIYNLGSNTKVDPIPFHRVLSIKPVKDE